LAVILISHNMSDVMAVADRVNVLRLGRNNGVFAVSDTSTQEIIAAITGATTNAVSERASRREEKSLDPGTTAGPDPEKGADR
jgi:D-xylose transport system ATP-binding protein